MGTRGAVSDEFTHRVLPHVGKRVHRLGLSLIFGIDPKGVAAAFERGINYVFWQKNKTGPALPVVREALARNREKMVIAAGPTLAFVGGSVRRGTERHLRALGVDSLDILQVYWVGRMSALTDAVVDEMVKLREEGKAKAIGLSIHDRPRAGRLAEDSPFDVLMIRYNAAHPGAEREIFPHLERRRPALVAYTATSWRKLLRAPRGWTGPVPTAGDCYRYCLTNPHVDVVLCGPKSERQLDENLAALERGPMSDDELRFMNEFGRAVHG